MKIKNPFSNVMSFVFPYRWPLRQLNKKKRKLENEKMGKFKNAIKKAEEKEKVDYEIFDGLGSEEDKNIKEVDYLIDVHLTDSLVNQSKKLMLPIYEGDRDLWKESEHLCECFLTDMGITKLRSAIRQERKERRDVFITWASMLIGLIGATTGLLAIILSG